MRCFATGVSSARDLRGTAIINKSAIALLTSFSGYAAARSDRDQLRDLQTDYVVNAEQKIPRVYHFGSQGTGDVFSNHTSHTNRLIPIYVFGQEGRFPCGDR